MSAIILYDGVCGLCNRMVKFTIAHDPEAKFKFAALQSDFGRDMLRKFDLSEKEIDSVVLIKDDRSYIKSAAALRIVRELKGLWKFLYIFAIVPAPIADYFYDIIANNRYKWFGKYDQCMIPTPDIKSRFIF